jgi:hypothetical protein
MGCASGIAVPLVQLAVPQLVVVGGGVPHTLRSDPLHCAAHLPVPTHAPRAPWGTPTTAVQVPAAPLTSHASHLPVQVLLQQTPSAQTPEPHSVPVVQATPRGLEQVPTPLALHLRGAVHEDDEQHTPSTQLPDEHCEGAVQVVPVAPVETHVVPEQKYPVTQSALVEQVVLQAVGPHV